MLFLIPFLLSSFMYVHVQCIYISLSLSLSVSPSSYNLVQGEIPSNARRALTLISKVLQNLANHVLFKKEAHMKVFNEFLADNFERSRE